MTKRHEPDTFIGTPVAKKERLTIQPPSEGFQRTFKPIFDARKIHVGDKALSSLEKEQTNPLVQALIRGYHQLEKAPPPQKQKELADFIIPKSMRVGGHQYGEVHRMNLLELPRGNPTLAGAYDSDNGVIELYPQSQFANPILSLIHEGTHVLDDKLMRTHQGPALDYLASQESAFKPVKLGPKSFDPERILTGAQRILPDQSFYREYTYGKEFKPDIRKAYESLDIPADTRTFSQARAALEAIRKQGSVPHHAPFFSFSEFPAHAMEHLYSPWQTQVANPQSAAFMHGILGEVQGHFRGLGLTPETHPSIMQGFEDRLRQLQEAARMVPTPAAGGGAAAAAVGMPAVPAAAAAAAAALPPATTIGKPAGAGLY